MFTQKEVEDAIERACDELQRIEPGSVEYVRQTMAIRNLTAALRTLKIMEED